jgi:N-acetylneuraminic acid mutarotase
MPKAAKVDSMWTMRANFPGGDTFDRVEFFYDGELNVTNGVIYVPTSKPEWAQRLLHLGYVWDNGVQPEDFHYL